MIRIIQRFIKMHRSLSVYGVLLLLGIIGVVIGLVPAGKNVFALITQVKTLETDISNFRTKIVILSSYEDSVFENMVHDVLAAIPQDKSVNTLLSTIEVTAAKNGLAVSSFSVAALGSIATQSGSLDKPDSKLGVNILPASFVVEGDISGLRDFLNDIIKIRRLIRVKSMDLMFQNKTTVIQAKVTVDAFYKTLPQTIGKVSDSVESLSQKEQDLLTKIISYPIVYEAPIIFDTVNTSLPANPVNADPFGL